MAEPAAVLADEGKSSLVAALGQRRGEGDSGVNQGEAEAPALISAHPAARTMTRSPIASADAGELTVMTNCPCVGHDD